MLHMKASSALVLPDRAQTTKNEADRLTISALEGVGLNLAALPREVLHLFQDGVIAELRPSEHRALEVINEKNINNE